MSLVDLDLTFEEIEIPADVRSFLREADRRIEEFQLTARVPGFVPSDYRRAYRILHALTAADLATGTLFCEWGSGFGVVACLASFLGFEACGIEIERDLVEAAEKLAADFDLPVEFIQGSFIPKTDAAALDAEERFAWLTTDESGGHDELGLEPDDFAVIFAYPWPDEEQVTEELFDRHAAKGAILVTYHGGEDFLIKRKTGKPSRRR